MEKATLDHENETKDFQATIVDQDAEDFDEGILEAPFDDPAGDRVAFRQKLTLIDFINLDNILSAYKLMIWEDPSSLIWFLSFFMLASIAFMNLVTAVIAENAWEEDRAGAREQATPQQVN